jgi:hypothetical protein
MHTNLIRVLPLILGLVLSTTARAAAPAANASAPASEVREQAGMVWVTSPWGFTDLYCVHHGWNHLRCSGTGLFFRYYWPGW